MNSYMVVLGSVRVGQLGVLRDGRWAFQFLPSYLRLADRPVLGQFFEDDLGKTYVAKKPGRLPAFFAHLLPEGRLRGILERSLGIRDSGDAELLAAVSRDLPGAVRLMPVDSAELDTLEAASVADLEQPSSAEPVLRFSLAGAQLKFSMLRDEDRFTVPAHGALGSWIVKIAIAGYEGLPANEFAMLAWARAVGFDVPQARLVGPEELGDLKRWIDEDSFGLAVRRYDREGTRRIHQEDFAQVIGVEPALDGAEKYGQTYDNVLKLVRAVVGPQGAEEMLRRIAFVVASGNADAHLKNWSLLYADGVRAELAPLYDQVATVAWPKHDRELALKLAGSREFGRVRLESFAHLARQVALDPVRVQRNVRETIAAACNRWQAALDAGLPDAHADAVRAHWRRVPLLRDVGTLA
jgi:serine/threonine-protein kinase HipA